MEVSRLHAGWMITEQVFSIAITNTIQSDILIKYITTSHMLAKIILLFWLTLSLGISIAEHGKPRKPTNATISFVVYILYMILLYFSGFFKIEI